MKFNSYKKASTLFVALLASGCASVPSADNQRMVSEDETRVFEDVQGRLVLAADVKGESSARDVAQTTSDCAGGGFGISTHDIQGDKGFLFDLNGLPCESSDILFDGTTPVGARPPAPGVAAISFIDQAGIQPEKPRSIDLPSLTEIDMPKNPLPEEVGAYKDLYKLHEKEPLNVDDSSAGLESTVHKWRQGNERADIVRDAEVLLAGMRDIRRMSDNELMKAHQQKLVELQSRVHTLEKENMFLKDYNNKLVIDISSSSSISDADKADYLSREQEMKRRLAQMSQRAEEAQRINVALRQEFMENEMEYKARVDELSDQLRSAERQADTSRQQMVLEAAKKIAEAEYLAQEAQLAKRLSMQRRSQRLSLEAGDLLDQAKSLGGGKPIVLPAFSGFENLPTFKVVGEMPVVQEKVVADADVVKTETPSADASKAVGDLTISVDMETLSVHLQEEDQPLKEVFESVFDDLADRAGPWQVVWKLKPENQAIAEEKWTVIADAPFNQFLSYVAKKVKAEKNVALTFQRFDATHTFVISDK